ncbi:HGxxPAAW family protein [Nocardioides pantholopis]|uniref:HGxxPAAW family protein n=1 Tax=Nocardioides pantholopis TaxID=2483798 RepID=UPI000F089DEC|nr:HGxxPAAW family protein [Nocardioides pantholopis]
MSASHGNTPAAWTGVTVAMIGFLVGSVALLLEPVNMTLFWIGAAIAAGSLVVFVVMDRLGLHESDH